MTELSTEDLLAQAVSYHQANQFEKAQTRYQQILEQDPQNINALHLLGVCFFQQGDAQTSMGLIEQAIAMNSSVPEFHINLANSLQALGQYDQAFTHLSKSIALNPNHDEAYFNLGNVLVNQEKYSDSVKAYKKAIELNPKHQAARNILGKILHKLELYDQAITHYDIVLNQNPNNISVLITKGNALLQLNKQEDALSSFNKALTIDPNHVEALANCGFILFNLQQHESALKFIDKALSIKPNRVNMLNIKGNILVALKRYEEALISFDKSLSIQPEYENTLNDRGNALFKLKRYKEAIASYEKATSINPNFAIANWNESACRLTVGDYDIGWKKFEWRWNTIIADRRRHFLQPLWLGKESIKNKTILLYAEQGFGDIIQFVRYVKKVVELGAQVILWVPPSLKSLMKSIVGIEQTFAFDEPLPNFDYQCPLMSLPLAFKTSADSIPADIPYLFSDSALTNQWKAKLSHMPRPYIGIVCWSGITPPELMHRYISLEKMARVVTKHASCVLIQKEINAEDKKTLAMYPHLLHAGENLHDFEDTAALIESMDLIISIDSCVAHLAGAMGKSTWILLPYHTDWRWLAEREDSPWYPTIRLFRQPKEDDWDSVLETVGTEISQQNLKIIR